MFRRDRRALSRDRADWKHATRPAGLALQPKSHIGGRPAALVGFFGVFPANSTGPIWLVRPDGTADMEWTLPAGTELVMTDLIVTLNGSPVDGQTRGGLAGREGAVSHPHVSFNATLQMTVSVSITGGVRWSVLPSYENLGVNAVFVSAYGYPVKAKK